MKLDATLDGQPAEVAGKAAGAERLGFAGVWAGETSHDALLPAALAAQATLRVTVGTRVVIAFARSPMTLAISGNDLQLLSGGRFVLGLGSQVRAHIERRYGAVFDHPAARMRELIAALRAIWTAWEQDSPLDFRGDFFSHTLMPPAFRPEPHSFGQPLIGLAAMGPHMLRVAGEAADALLVHAFMTPDYLRQEVLPAVRGAAAGAGRAPGDVQVCLRLLLATGRDEAQLAAATREVRNQIAFYASTRAYAGVLALHGWAGLQPELAALARQGRWSELGQLIDDDVLHAFAVVGEPAAVGAALRDRFAGLADRAVLRCPVPLADEQWAQILSGAAASSHPTVR